MADDSASSKGVSRGGNGAVGSGSTKSGSGTKSSAGNSGTGTGGKNNGPSGGMMGGTGSGGSVRTSPSTGKSPGTGTGGGDKGNLGIAGVPGGVNKQGGSLAKAGPSTGAGGDKGNLGIAGVPGGVNKQGGPQAPKGGGGVSGIANSGNAFGPRADSARFAVSPSADLGSYVKDPSRVPASMSVYGATPDQYAALNQGVGALTRQVSAPVQQGPGVTSLNAPVNSAPPGAFGGFNPNSPLQQQAVDRGLIGSLNLQEKERANITVGANSPLAAPENQFGTNPQYDPLSSPRAPMPNRMANSYDPLSSVRTPASIAQQQDIANIYGDPTLGNIPLPSGRAFNNTQPVPTPASQYAGYGNFNVPVTPANQQVQQLAKVDTQPMPQAYDPLSSFNRYVAPTVAALEGNTAPQTGPNTSTVAKNGTLTREQVVGQQPPESNFVIAEPPAISQAQWDAFNAYRNPAPVAASNPATVSLSNIADPNNPNAANLAFNDQARWNAFNNAGTVNTAVADAASVLGPSYDPLTSFNAPFGQFPNNPGQRVTNIFASGNPADIGKALSEQILANRPGAVIADNTPVYDNSSVYDPTAPIDLPDPAPPTDRYIGPVYPGQEGGTNRGQTMIAGNGNSSGQYIVPTSGSTPSQPTTPPVDTGGGNTGTPSASPWFDSSFANPAYTTVIPTPQITQVAPISTGVGSLLPNIVVIDPFTGQPVR